MSMRRTFEISLLGGKTFETAVDADAKLADLVSRFCEVGGLAGTPVTLAVGDRCLDPGDALPEETVLTACLQSLAGHYGAAGGNLNLLPDGRAIIRYSESVDNSHNDTYCDIKVQYYYGSWKVDHIAGHSVATIAVALEIKGSAYDMSNAVYENDIQTWTESPFAAVLRFAGGVLAPTTPALAPLIGLRKSSNTPPAGPREESFAVPVDIPDTADDEVLTFDAHGKYDGRTTYYLDPYGSAKSEFRYNAGVRASFGTWLRLDKNIVCVDWVQTVEPDGSVRPGYKESLYLTASGLTDSSTFPNCRRDQSFCGPWPVMQSATYPVP
eukprot:TRINITY_DN63719_c0_g1_i1.p1 TRINITY_DN63719_c0_g1~~TRINITY_DN63719_c0_g1_i1.p1  ORF type:complete len:325 (-),score=19.00 TRINITY_DN63719_c0_g1_i1:321-1295(-)